MTVATESGHWYDREGKPCYTMIGKNGKERNVTLRDAREHGYLPSVTSILSIQAKPALTNWFVDQAIEAAYKLAADGWSDPVEWAAAVKKASKEGSEAARNRGTALHGAIECYLLGKAFDLSWEPHVNAVKDAMRAEGLDLYDGISEHSFASELGFGGKTDWHNDKSLVDFKSKQVITDGNLVYDEHNLQAHAYDRGIGGPVRQKFMVFIGADDNKVRVCECDPDDRYWEWFKALLKVWQLSRNYTP